jgi:hypothetical protein
MYFPPSTNFANPWSNTTAPSSICATLIYYFPQESTMTTYFDTYRKKTPHSDADIQKIIEAAGEVAKDMVKEQT